LTEGEQTLECRALAIDRRVRRALGLALRLVSAGIGARDLHRREPPEHGEQMRDGILDAIEGLAAVGTVLGLEVLGELGHGDLVHAPRDDAAFDRGALA